MAVIELERLKLENRARREKNREQERQRKLDDKTALHLERQRIRGEEQKLLEAAREERSRLDSLASVEQTQEIQRLYEEDLRERKRLRDEAGIRAGGGYKRLAATQPVVEPYGKKRMVGIGDQRSRYGSLI